jgi:hypothetical protein
MVMKSVRIRWLDGSFTFWACATEILVEPRGMMVDDYNYASRLTWLSGQSVNCRYAEEFAEARYLVRFEAMCVRALEKRTLRAEYKCKLVASMRLDFT